MMALSELLPRHAWMSHASCASLSLWDVEDLFFPFSDSQEAAKRALKICQSCPVLSECREWTIQSDKEWKTFIHGVSGGLYAAQRRRIASPERLPTCPQCGFHLRKVDDPLGLFPGTLLPAPDGRCTRCARSDY